MADTLPTDGTPLDRVLAALANPLRRELVDRLATGPETAGELANGAGVSMPSMSRHLRILEEAGLIVRLKQGRNHVIELKPDALTPAVSWLAALAPAGVAVSLDTAPPSHAAPSSQPTPVPDSLSLESLVPAADDDSASAPTHQESPGEPDLSPDSLSSLVEQLRGRR